MSVLAVVKENEKIIWRPTRVRIAGENGYYTKDMYETKYPVVGHNAVILKKLMIEEYEGRDVAIFNIGVWIQ